MMKRTATASALNSRRLSKLVAEHQIEIQGLQAKVDVLNIPQLQRDINELKKSPEELISQNVVDVDSHPRAAKEPSPQIERALRQMGRLRELEEVRDAMIEVNGGNAKERAPQHERSMI
ncbi:hypothetical protein GCK32_003449 [Trichostrongylus colubriformis]|uniref:Uncharacterized protein n=1 Tax=Trichostrongylus colubriformis TaxID=6319 RepID=A0AAN8FYZ2_TRICO